MVDSIGTIYIKKPFHVTVGADGIEEAIAGILLPPYVIPNRYWIKSRLIGQDNPPTHDARSIQPMRISGRIGDFPRDYKTDADPPSAGLQLLTDLMETYLPHEPGSVGDSTADAQEDVGLPGSEIVAIKSQEFFSRDLWLGLPKNALIVDTDIIRYVDYFTTKGRIPNSKVGRYDEATIIGFGGTTEDWQTQAESDIGLLGATANAAPQLEVILTEILDQIEANTAGDTPVLFSTGMGGTKLFNTQTQTWQLGAYGTAVPGDAAKSFDVTTVLTVQCDVRIPQYDTHFVARS